MGQFTRSDLEVAMDDTFIITIYVIFAEMSSTFLPPLKYKPKMTPAEILTVAVVAAKYFNNNLERALCIMSRMGYFRQPLGISRFNRQLHQHAAFLELGLATLCELGQSGEAFVLDSMPVPVCKRKRAWRCRKVRGREYCGYCAAKGEKFFGWRLHLICTPEGWPAAFELLPAAFHDLTPIYELTVNLPEDAGIFTDKAYNSAQDEEWLALDGVRLIPIRKKNMQPHTWADDYDLRLYRKSIETVNSQLESMGVERLKARTNEGLEIKLHASLVALFCTNAVLN